MESVTPKFIRISYYFGKIHALTFHTTTKNVYIYNNNNNKPVKITEPTIQSVELIGGS